MCPALAITLPNGFTFNETLYSQPGPTVNIMAERCEYPYGGCSSDCSTLLYCNGMYQVKAGSAYTCDSEKPYCVPKSSTYISCSGNFPMDNQECVTRALNNFICTSDGEFPDPTDCTKYHICNGATHSIVECSGQSEFSPGRTVENTQANPGNGEFRCRFVPETCIDCNKFLCYGNVNTFMFREGDYFYYAYCLKIGTTKKTLIFKCPNGTSHSGYRTGNTVLCLAPGEEPPML